MGGTYHDIGNRINLEEPSTVKSSRLANWGYPTWPYWKWVANATIIVKNIREKSVINPKRAVFVRNTSRVRNLVRLLSVDFWTVVCWALAYRRRNPPGWIFLPLFVGQRASMPLSTMRSRGELTPWSITCDILHYHRLLTAVGVGMNMKQFSSPESAAPITANPWLRVWERRKRRDE